MYSGLGEVVEESGRQGAAIEELLGQQDLGTAQGDFLGVATEGGKARFHRDRTTHAQSDVTVEAPDRASQQGLQETLGASPNGLAGTTVGPMGQQHGEGASRARMRSQAAPGLSLGVGALRLPQVDR